MHYPWTHSLAAVLVWSFLFGVFSLKIGRREALILGNRRTAGMMLKKAGGSLFALHHAMPHQNGDLLKRNGLRPTDA